MKLSLLAATAALVVAAHAPEAAAVDVTRDYLSHGVANCQSALPVFDGLIRKRPKALVNEGNTNAFVTCDFEHFPNVMGRIERVSILMINRNAGPVSVSCTLVQGLGNTNFHPVIVKSVDLAPGILSGLGWEPADNGGERLTAPAVSCNLQPGVEIGATQLILLEDVGA